MFPNLVLCQKWHTQHREVKVGDIVILRENNDVRGDWMMAIVTETVRGAVGIA